MKIFTIASMLFLVGACATQSYNERIRSIKEGIEIESPELAKKYANTITAQELRSEVYIIASDLFEGRKTGSKGQRLAANHIKQFYIDQSIKSPIGGLDYFQDIPGNYFTDPLGPSENVLAFIEGEELAHEVVVITGHYDHEGIDKNGNFFYGADDNASGTSALMEIAEAFNLAKNDGHKPKRSLLFIHMTAEEVGMEGSRYYSENPVFPLENTVAALNVDMIGRVDDSHMRKGVTDYIYLIGTKRLSTELHYTSELVNQEFVNIELNYRYNGENDPNRYYFRSDHYNFAKHDIPVIFYFNGVHKDYSQITDTPDKINYDLLEKRTKLIFHTAWQLANQDKRVAIDKESKK